MSARTSGTQSGLKFHSPCGILSVALLSSLLWLTAVRECCKDDDASQWKNVKFDHSRRQSPSNDRNQNLYGWLCPWYIPLCKILSRIQIRSGVLPLIREIAHPGFGFFRFFRFFQSSTVHSRGSSTDFHAKYVNDTVQCKNVPFGG